VKEGGVPLADSETDVERLSRELSESLEQQAATVEILNIISNSPTDTQPVFDSIVQSGLKLFPDALICVALRDGDLVEAAAIADRDPVRVEAWRRTIFHTPLKREYMHGAAILDRRIVDIPDVVDAPAEFSTGAQNFLTSGYRAITIMPMVRGDEAIGLLSVVRLAPGPLSNEQVGVLRTFAAQAVIAVENVRQFKALQVRTEEVQRLNSDLESRVATQVDELERLGRLRRFLSPQVADAVVSSGNDKLLSSHRALIATLFGDMRGFTTFCESTEPEEAIEVLQTYHEVMGRLIHEHGAGVDHRAGDGIMVIFNDPLPCDDPAGDALRLALAMREHMATLCTEWRKLGHRLGFGVGISLGYATVGMVGSEGRYDYTASGTSVNLAARLCDHAADGEILLSPRAFAALENRIEAQSVGELVLKGINAPVDVFRVLHFIDSVSGMDI
jgi:class 3 adenylate cyclase